MASYEYVFPSIRGVQAGREYFVSMCPLKLIPRIFLFDEEELPANLRAQRVLNKSRIPEMARYIVKNTKGYVFSAITASIDGEVEFVGAGPDKQERDLGTLHIPMSAKFLINDGQHRRAAIESALKENPELGNETIAVVFFVDAGLKRSQQMFADLNRYAVRPTRSLSILYDHRDEWSLITKELIQNVPVFKELTETERSTISNRSIKLFTLSGIYYGTSALLENKKGISVENRIALTTDFWREVSRHMKDWQLALERKVRTSELRQNTIHAHTLALHALGRAGAALIEQHPRNWRSRLSKLEGIDWSRHNNLWEQRALIGGHVAKTRTNVILTANAIKRALGVSLTPEEKQMEEGYRGTEHGKKHRRGRRKAKVRI